MQKYMAELDNSALLATVRGVDVRQQQKKRKGIYVLIVAKTRDSYLGVLPHAISSYDP